MGRTQVILLDTHVVVWLAFDQSQLSRNAKAAINHARQNGDGLAISDITLLELTTLSRKARVRLDISLESFLREGRGTVHCPADQRPRVCTRPRTPSDLS
jgi:PIN domain nuclease of toxin-antitoxin system